MNEELNIGSEQTDIVEETGIDKQKLNRIVKTIITLENDNVKTRELNDEDMKKKIEKIIEEEIKCC